MGFSQMSKIGKEIVDIAENNIPLSKSLTHLTEDQLHHSILFEKAMFKVLLAERGDAKARQKYSDLRVEIKELTDKVLNDIVEIEDFIKKRKDHLHTEEAKKEYEKIYSGLKNAEAKYRGLKTKIDNVLDLGIKGEIDQAVALSSDIEKIQEELEHGLVGMLDRVQDFTLASSVQAEHDEQSGIVQIGITMVVAMIIALILPTLVLKSVTKPIKILNERLLEIAEGDGDLTVSISHKANDELGNVANSFNKLLQNLRKTIQGVNVAADTLGTSSESAIDVMETTLVNVHNQLSETELIAEAVKEMSNTIRNVAASTSEASSLAENVKNRVAEGKKTAIDSQSIIEHLSTEVDNTSNVIKSLASETDNIGSVLDTIRGIAEQTNLLALNAAIEAARAGDTGRGFAVVADEVRSLAQRTQESTGDIQALVERLQNEAQKAVESMKNGSESTKLCLNKSLETAKALEDSSNAVNEITDLNLSIASAAEEQTNVADQINTRVTNVKNVAQTTAEGSESVSQANQNIAKELVGLHSNLNRFVV